MYGVYDKQISCIVQILNTILENEQGSQRRKLLLLLLFLFYSFISNNVIVENREI